MLESWLQDEDVSLESAARALWAFSESTNGHICLAEGTTVPTRRLQHLCSVQSSTSLRVSLASIRNGAASVPSPLHTRRPNCLLALDLPAAIHGPGSSRPGLTTVPLYATPFDRVGVE